MVTSYRRNSIEVPQVIATETLGFKTCFKSKVAHSKQNGHRIISLCTFAIVEVAGGATAKVWC